MLVKATWWHSLESEEVLLRTTHLVYFAQRLNDRVAILGDKASHIVEGVALQLADPFGTRFVVLVEINDAELF